MSTSRIPRRHYDDHDGLGKDLSLMFMRIAGFDFMGYHIADCDYHYPMDVGLSS